MMGGGDVNADDYVTQAEKDAELFATVRQCLSASSALEINELRDKATLLLGQKANPNWGHPEYNHMTALHQAMYIDDESDRVNPREETGETEMVSHLVLFGKADPSNQDDHGDTPLHKAATNGHMKTVRWLVEQGGADVLIRNKMGKTPAQCAVRIAPKSTVGRYLQGKVESTPPPIPEKEAKPAAAAACAVGGGHMDLPAIKKEALGAVASSIEIDQTWDKPVNPEAAEEAPEQQVARIALALAAAAGVGAVLYRYWRK